MDEYTVENARDDLDNFLNPIRGSLSDKQRATAFQAFDVRIASGAGPKEAFEQTVNEVFGDYETDETVRVRMEEICTETSHPRVWKALWANYMQYREIFCPYAAFQLYLYTLRNQMDEVASMLAREDTINKMIADGLSEERAVMLAAMIL